MNSNIEHLPTFWAPLFIWWHGYQTYLPCYIDTVNCWTADQFRLIAVSPPDLIVFAFIFHALDRNLLVLPCISVLGGHLQFFPWCEHKFFCMFFFWNTGWKYGQRSSIWKKKKANLWVFQQSVLLAVLILKFLHSGVVVERWEAKMHLQLPTYS